MTMHRSLAISLALATAATAAAQDARPVAFTNARLVTIAGKTIERGTLVVKNGKIEALGADIAVPPGARVVDASGKTILPGLVSAFSRAGLQAPPPRTEDRQPQGRRGGRPDFPPQQAGPTAPTVPRPRSPTVSTPSNRCSASCCGRASRRSR